MMKLTDVAAYLFDFGVDILVTTFGKATGVLTAQIGDSTSETPDSDNAEWWQHVGFASRPARPTKGGPTAQGCIIRRGDRDIIFTTRDTRGTAILGNLADGEACVYAPGAQGRMVFKADGSVRGMTTDDGTPTGNTVQEGISPLWQSPSGPQSGGEWRYQAPWGGAWHDPSGYHLRTWHGIKIDFGGVVLPAPLSLGQTSTLTMSADTAFLDFAMVNIGRANGTATPQALIQALPQQGVMSTLAACLTDIGAQLTSAGHPATSIPGAVAALNSLMLSAATKSTTAG